MKLTEPKGGRLYVKSIQLPFILLALTALIFSSCTKDYFDLDKVKDAVYYPEWAVPVGKSTLNVYDILDRFDNDDLIIIDSTSGLLALVYYSQIFSITAEQLISIPDQNVTAPFALTNTEINDVETNGSTTITPPPVTVNFATTGEQLETIIFKGGSLDYTINNSIPYGGTMTVNIPSLVDLGGSPYSRSFSFTPGPGGGSASDPLLGWTLDLSKGGTTQNEFDINFSINFVNGPGTAVPADLLNFSMGMNNIQFAFIGGDIGQQNVQTGLDSVRIRIFDKAIDGTVTYEDPKLRALFFNSYGANLQVAMNRFESYSPVNGSVIVQDLGSGFGQGSVVIIASPTLPQIGQEILTQINLNNTNSNITQLIASSPTHIIYDVDAITNPGAGPFNNFVLDSSLLHLDIEVELPLHGTAQNFTKIDTMAFDFNDIDTLENIEGGTFAIEITKATFRLNTDNGFPTEGRVQVYFLNNAFQILDSLVANPNEYVILSGVLGSGGRVVQSTKKITDFVIDKAKLDFLKANNSTFVLIKSIIETTNMGMTTIKVFKEYEMEVRLGVMVEEQVTARIN